jgi:hypothetical protein
MLGHSLGGILKIYNKSNYTPEQKEAYQLWEKLVIPNYFIK